jgi:hypothetical protein
MAGTIAVLIILLVLAVAAWQDAAGRADDLQAAEDRRQEESDARPNLEEVVSEAFTDPDVAVDGDTDAAEVSIPGYALLSGTASLEDLLDELGFSSAVLGRMERTRALDGTQDAEGRNVNVTWTYHPDDGLNLVFEAE